MVNKLHSYTQTQLRQKDLAFHQITVSFIRRYEIHLKSLGNAVTTIHSDIKKIRAIYHLVILEEITPQAKNPFTIFRSQFKAPKKAKTKLTSDELHAFKTVVLPPHSYLWHVRNMFLFSFYAGGLRIGDILSLRWINVHQGRLRYGMEKTDIDRSVLLLPQALTILDHYRDPENRGGDFIFPIMDGDKDYTSVKTLSQEKEIKTAVVNKYLKQIAAQAGIMSKITSHTARHSAADFLRREGVSVYDISKILGHSKISTTEVYLASLDQDSMDDALGALGRM